MLPNPFPTHSIPHYGMPRFSLFATVSSTHATGLQKIASLSTVLFNFNEQYGLLSTPMLIIHAVQKLLNTSRLKTALYVSQPDEGQLLHSWYARLLSTGFQGKLFVMYVHEPSLLTIVCRGKTINSTWVEFSQRLPHLLKRFRFPATFVAAETELANDYVVAKTDNRSILSHMNQMIIQLEFDCSRFDNYESISQDLLEDRMMDYLYQAGTKSKPYITPVDYWKQRLVLR